MTNLRRQYVSGKSDNRKKNPQVKGVKVIQVETVGVDQEERPGWSV